jgi:hypothetical protein
MQAKLITTFDRLSEADFLAKAGTIVTALTANKHFPEPWATQAPTLVQLSSDYNTYQDSYYASLSHDNIKINLRNIARDTLTADLKRLIPYLELVADGDVNILISSGYDLRKDLGHGANNTTLTAPEDFRVTQGTKSGSLDVHVSRLSGAGCYEVQLAKTDPNIDGNWHHELTSINCTHILLEDLIIGQTYWVRVRGIGATSGSGAWTIAIKIIVN